MNELIESALLSGVATIVGSSAITSSTNIVGTAVEVVSRSEVALVASRVVQSVLIAFMTIWASHNLVGAIYPPLICASSPFLALAAASLLIPVALRAGAHYWATNRGLIETMEGQYNVAIKASNIVAGIMTLGVSISSGVCTPLYLAMNAWSAISSSYLLREAYMRPLRT